MKEYRASKGERVDQIIFKEYGTLESIGIVLEVNTHLLRKVELEAGDRVYLPDLQKEAQERTKKGKALW